MATILDKHVRRFLDTSSVYKNADGFLGTNDREDPTYLGFTVEFIFNDIHGKSHARTTVPMGLLLDENDNDSAIQYFKNIGMNNESVQIAKFRTLLKELQTKTPHYFQSITGLDDAYKIDPDAYSRGTTSSGENKKIVIDTLESLDFRMTLLADLYRKSMFDTKAMSWKCPDNVREFNMNIYVTEIRSFHTITQKYVNAVNGRSNGDIPLDTNKSKIEDYSAIAKKFNDVNNTFNETIDNIEKKPSDAATYEALSSWNDNISILEFRFRGCEFEFFGDFAPSYLDTISNADMGEPISMSIPIIYKDIEEVNEYKIFDLILKDSNTKVETIGGESKIQLTHPQVDRETFAKKRQKDLNDINEQNRNNLSPLDRALLDRGFNPDGLVGKVADKAKANLLNRVNNAENRVLLGNAYGFQPDVRSILDQGAKFLRNQINPLDRGSLGEELGNIGLTGSGPDIRNGSISIDIDGGEGTSTNPKSPLGNAF